MRLIDGDALMETIKQNDYMLANKTNSMDRGMFTLGIQQAIDDAPTIDPVKRGEWKHNVVQGWYCTSCYWRMSAHCQTPTYQHNFCPNCGADMRKEKEGVE